MPVVIAGVLNVTPDSFSDGGQFTSVDSAVAAGLVMAGQGAQWIDVGGESTRPMAEPVAEDEEIRRVVPVVEQLAAHLGSRARVSIDTYKAGTAAAALAAGATIVNDVSGGLLDPAILRVAAERQAVVVLGHLRGRPATMMADVHFDDVLAEVARELDQRIAAARRAGCREVWADPGLGFGKRTEHNLRLLAGLDRLKRQLGVPVMVGVSRKRFIGELTGKPVGDRGYGTAAAVAAAVWAGADAVRVHDVAEMRDVIAVAEAILHHGNPERVPMPSRDASLPAEPAGSARAGNPEPSRDAELRRGAAVGREPSAAGPAEPAGSARVRTRGEKH
jgi:dihydropteroate synthase